MTEQLLRKRTVLVAVLLAAAVLLIVGTRTWVSGRVSDPVLGLRTLHGAGSQVARASTAAALVGAAAAVAAATTGAVARVVAGVATLLSGVLAAGVAIGVLGNPSGALSSVAASSTGRSSPVRSDATASGWVLVAVVAAVVMALGGVAILLANRRWAGLSARYEVPAEVEASTVTGPVGGAGSVAADRQASARARSDWDLISAGEDPTVQRSDPPAHRATRPLGEATDTMSDDRGRRAPDQESLPRGRGEDGAG